MQYLYVIAAATIISLVLVPFMMSHAERLGMVDHPSGRRVHAQPIPRVGGWGIVFGTLIPLFAMTTLTPLLGVFIYGSLILLLFGALDDRYEMGPKMKFIGQFLAAVPLVVFGDFFISQYPVFVEWQPPVALSMGITIVCLVAMINATNQSDGLDGLAGGESLLTLAGIALLAYLAESSVLLIVALAAVGGVLGFLRYNTHPARVFMGDSGAQFLGFVVGFLAIWLTQYADTELSAAAMLPLLGLPVFDFFLVLYVRLRNKQPIFKASKHHIHHRLLDRGFVHKETVTIIYVLHAAMVLSGLLLRHAHDLVILAAYAGICGVFLLLLTSAERRDWRAHESGLQFGQLIDMSGDIDKTLRKKLLVVFPRRALEFLIPVYLVAVTLLIDDVDIDYGFVALILLIPVALQSFLRRSLGSTPRRLAVYTVTVFVVYLCAWDRSGWQRDWAPMFEMGYYIAVALCVAVAIRFSPRRRKEEFRVTSLDYLLLFVVLCSIFFADFLPVGQFSVPIFIVALVVMLYGIELLMVERKQRADWLGKASGLALLIIAWRGLDLVRLDVYLMPVLDRIIG